MNRRSFLRHAGVGGLVVTAVALNVGCASETPGYYLSNDGNDDNDGLTPETAWQSIPRLDQALQGGEISYGDSVFFHRGHEFFGSITTLGAAEAASPSNGARVTLAAYGDGDRPKISGYKLIDKPDAWERAGAGIWRVNLTDGVSFGGNVANISANTGFLRVDGRIYGAKKWRLEALAAQWDFFNDDTHLYVRSAMRPDYQARDIRAAADATLITGYSHLAVQGLELLGSGGHGYRQTTVTDTEVSDCRIHEIGGAQLDGTTRYGNGVELWMGSSDATITRNEIFDVYDVACTMQGPQEGDGRSITNCHYTDNKIWNCTQAFEYWGTGSDTGPGAGFVECSFESNVCINGGESWSYPVREDRDGKGNFLMAYSQELPTDIRVTGNVFFDARDCYLFVNTNDFRLREGYVSDDNAIALRKGTRIQAQMELTIEQSAEWVARTKQEATSRWMLVPPSVVTPQDALDYVAANLDALRNG